MFKFTSRNVEDLLRVETCRWLVLKGGVFLHALHVQLYTFARKSKPPVFCLVSASMLWHFLNLSEVQFFSKILSFGNIEIHFSTDKIIPSSNSVERYLFCQYSYCVTACFVLDTNAYFKHICFCVTFKQYNYLVFWDTFA